MSRRMATSWDLYIYPSTPDVYWRFKWPECLLPHILWQRLSIHRVIAQVKTYIWDFTPVQYLLHYTPLSWGQYFKSVTIHIVHVAVCIPVYWKSIQIPKMTELFPCLDRTSTMEEPVRISQDRLTKYLSTWACWQHFTYDFFKFFFSLLSILERGYRSNFNTTWVVAVLLYPIGVFRASTVWNICTADYVYYTHEHNFF